MPQYLILANDHTDDKALQRRLEARSEHLKRLKEIKNDGKLLTGGAMINKEGNMNGSMLLVEFESEEALNEWIENDPYITSDVWEKHKIIPFKTAVIE